MSYTLTPVRSAAKDFDKAEYALSDLFSSLYAEEYIAIISAEQLNTFADRSALQIGVKPQGELQLYGSSAAHDAELRARFYVASGRIRGFTSRFYDRESVQDISTHQQSGTPLSFSQFKIISLQRQTVFVVYAAWHDIQLSPNRLRLSAENLVRERLELYQ